MTVRVEGITKRFAGQAGAPAVENVSFSARAGVLTTLLGPSGSGKSTLLRVIAGLEHPDSGKVYINGLESTRVSPRQRNVGFVFQNYALFRHMTVFENVAFGMRVRKRPSSDVKARVEELLELVQLAGFANRFPGQLSGGQRQRVALARALATSPQVLLLDEPFGALDARVRLELREWLLGFQERAGVTTLMVTHDQEEALELSEQIVLLNQGKIEQSGSPHHLYDSPATPFVASFIGGGSELRGTVNGGRAAVGSLELRAPDGVPDGVSVRALVRPHDIRLAKNPESEQGLTLARVDRMRRIGPSVKLLLELPNGEPITVTMSKTELDELGICDGEKVFVDLRHAKVFVDDYVI